VELLDVVLELMPRRGWHLERSSLLLLHHRTVLGADRCPDERLDRPALTGVQPVGLRRQDPRLLLAERLTGGPPQLHDRRSGQHRDEGFQYRLARSPGMPAGEVAVDGGPIDPTTERLDDIGFRPAARDPGVEVFRQL
jgi:hypothetical protein